MKNNGRPWIIQAVEARHGNTPFEELVQDRRRRGMRWREIAQEFGVSRQTVWRYSGLRSISETVGVGS